MKLKFKKEALKEYIFITVGSAIMSLSIAMLVDVFVVPGGAAGLSMVLHYLLGGDIPIGVLKWIINVPLFIWGYRTLGNTFGIRTFYGFTTCSIFIDLFRGALPGFSHIRIQDTEFILDLVHNDFLFLVIIASVLMGVGLGIIFKYKGTTGGSDIGAAILNNKFGIMPGKAIVMIDFFVIALAGAVIYWKGLSFDKPVISLILYALVLLFLSSYIVDIIIDGFDYARMVLIVSDKNPEIAQTIMNDMSRGATAIKSRGIYRNIDTEIIMTVVTLKEISKLNDIVKSIDPKAFMITTTIHEVAGHGFRRRI